MLLVLSELYKVSITEILHGERSKDNYKEISDSTMVEVLKESKYEAIYDEKKLRKTWLKKHIIELILEVGVLYSLLVIANSYKISYLAFITLTLNVVWAYITCKRIKSYIEKNFFGKIYQFSCYKRSFYKNLKFTKHRN